MSIDKAIKCIGECIDNSYKKIDLLKRLRVSLVIKEHFPEGIDKGHRFFVINRKEYRKNYMWGYRDTGLEFKGLKGLNLVNRDKQGNIIKPKDTILIMDFTTRKWVEVDYFELPELKNNLISFGAKKNERKKTNTTRTK